MSQRNHRLFTSRWLSGAAAGWVTVAGGHAFASGEIRADVPAHQQPEALGEACFHYDGVLGTSMELAVRSARADEVSACERVVLAEIDRLTAILSTYDSTSEISRYMRGSSIQSQELAELLDLYALWTARTAGAIHVNMAGVKGLWQDAQNSPTVPSRSELREAFARPMSLNVDALGKGFLIDRAVEAARRVTPSGLLNIGGDIRTWGNFNWPVGIADPRQPADNMPSMAEFELCDAAVACSGGYARNFTIAGQRYSHIIDPRTLEPVTDMLGTATVVAPDCVTANAISTAACVMGADVGHRLALQYACGHLLTDVSGIWRGGRLSQMPISVTCADKAPVAASNWPKDFQVAVELNLKSPAGGRAKRPYVAVWIEDENDTVVRNLATWGNSDRYLPELSAWWKANNGNERRLRSIASATRAPGKYTVTWDGKDDFGQPVPQGTYHVVLEINREHGRHAREWGSIVCADKTEVSTVPETPESQESKISYEPKNKP